MSSNLVALRWLVALHTLTLWLSAPTLLGYAAQVHFFPVADPFTSVLLRGPWSYLVPLGVLAVGGLGAWLWPSRWTLGAWALTELIVGALLLLHQASFGWAGAVLLFWGGVWGLWLTFVRPDVARRRGPGLALLLLGGLFLLPALGKLTPGYLTGQIYYELHFANGQGLHYFLGPALGPTNHRALASVWGPLSIAFELAVAFCWALPGRLGFALPAAAAAGITLLGGFGFIDATGLLAGLVLSGFWLTRSQPGPAGDAPTAPPR